MKLYQTYLSPFPTRVRLLLYAKGLNVEIITPPGFHGDPKAKGAYMEVNKIGRIPALVLDDGTVLPESEVICEYLEDAYPEPPMHPAEPLARAKMRLLSRISDIYIVMAMLPLFEMVALPPDRWNQERIGKQIGEIAGALTFLEEHISESGYAVGDALTQADGALIPILLLVDEWLPIFRPERRLLGAVPKTAAYWKAIQGDTVAARVIRETRDALRQSMSGAKA